MKGIAWSGMKRYNDEGGMSEERKTRRAVREAARRAGLAYSVKDVDKAIMAGKDAEAIIGTMKRRAKKAAKQAAQAVIAEAAPEAE